MKDINDLFWSASVEELQRGYVYDHSAEEYTCLICGKSFTKGVIYTHNDILYEAERFTKIHIDEEHSSVFEYLLQLDKRLTGLTDLQKTLLTFFHEGHSDAEVVKELGGGSTSTIRNHRFNLREKEKQAKIFLAIMGLLESKSSKKQAFINVPRSAKMVDERFAITEEENEEILKAHFKQGLDGPLSKFPLKEKRKVAVLKHILKRFNADEKYTENEVNKILKEAYGDYVLLRRYLIEYGFMDRHRDGSTYWVR